MCPAKVLSQNLSTYYVELPSGKKDAIYIERLKPAIIKETCILQRSPANIESISKVFLVRTRRLFLKKPDYK